jgi:uracil-DNA glycosylase family 4
MNSAWQSLRQDIITCQLCPRLVAWREQVGTGKRRAYRSDDYWARPLPGFGDPSARLLVLGLAPAAHGGNRTGRMFTGDSSADFLIAALHRAGFANRPISHHRQDGLKLHDAFISAAARCAPPNNKPLPAELTNCRSFLARELALLTNLRLVLALGQIAFDAWLRLVRQQSHSPSPLPRARFQHGQIVDFPSPLPTLLASYHPSRQNTQTGRLTVAMFDDILAQARALLP